MCFVWREIDVMKLRSECHLFVYVDWTMIWICWASVMCLFMKWWCYWVSVMCLSMKWGWCDEVVEWMSCVCVWSDDDLMIFLNECHVFVYEVGMKIRCCCVSVICLSMKWGWCDEDVGDCVSCVYVWSKNDEKMLLSEWVSCVCVWSEDDVMKLLSECHVFVYEVRMMWWCC